MINTKTLLKCSVVMIFLCVSFLQSKAQQKIGLESLIPPAPNAAGLGKYGTYPVGTATGVPDIGFPLYQVVSGSLKLPISLSYHASGIQVNDKSTDIGLGWSIMAGGQITRTVFSAADDGPYGYFNYTPPSYSTLYGIHNYYTMATYNIVSNSGFDLEPDLFVYNMAGRSGKFHCDQSKNFVTVPFDPINIQKITAVNGKPGFRITDDNGIVYVFDNYGTTYTEGSPSNPGPIGPRTTISSWYLTSMISPDLTDTISFAYDTQITHDVMEQHVYPIGEDINGPVYGASPTASGIISGGVQQTESDITYTELLLKQINFKNGYIRFNRNTLRKDYSTQAYSLDEMIVYSTNDQVVKRFNFNHDYFQASPFYDDYAHYRLKLTGFAEADVSGQLQKVYRFDYNNTALPPHNSSNMDYWGYYNGSSNITLVPQTTLTLSNLGTTTIQGVTYTNPTFSATDQAATSTFGDANREPSAAYMAAGTLSKITYPTGGYTVFEFEPHQYSSDAYITQNITRSGGATGINKSTKSTSAYSFSYPSAPSLYTVNQNPVWASIVINFSASNISNTEFGETQAVTLLDGLGNVLRTWTHTGDLTVPLAVNTNFYLQPGATYSLQSDVYGDNTVNISNSINWTENTNQHAIKAGGGLRVKSIKSYGADNSLLKEENYTYASAENGLGIKFFDEQNFYRNYEDVVYDYFQPIGSGGACTRVKTTWLRNFMGISKYNAINYMGSPVLYPTVTKYEGNTTTNSGKTVYNFGIVSDPNNFPMEFVNSGNYGTINNAWHQGELQDETAYENYGGQYLPVSKTSYAYATFNYRIDTAILFKQYKQFVQSGGCSTDPTGPDPGNNWPGQGYFALRQYFIKTGAYKKVQETRVVYNQHDPWRGVTSVTSMQYQNPANLYPTEVSSTTSDPGIAKIIRQKYPQDMSDAVSVAMVAKNILSPVLEEKAYKSQSGVESLLTTTKTNYKQTGNLIVRDNINTAKAALPLETRFQFNQYDTYGNILEQQKTNDVKEVYLWGYNGQYPVAKITGSDYTTVNSMITQSQIDVAITTDLQNNTGGSNLRTLLNGLRTQLTQSQVTTYTYTPLIGMSSQTDPKGQTTFYEYDGLGRLKLIRDNNNAIIKRFEYKYSGQ